MAAQNKLTILPTAIIFVVSACQLLHGASAQTVNCVDITPTPIEERMDTEFTIDGENVVMCSDNTCKNLSLDTVRKAYPDAFTKKREAKQTTGLQYNKYVKEVPSVCYDSTSKRCKFWSDNDQCCRTWRYVTFTIGPLTNIAKQSCYIIQIPHLRLYQFISIGFCGHVNECKKCVQQYTIQSLLAWCPGYGGLRMHHFRIPTYCSCQG